MWALALLCLLVVMTCSRGPCLYPFHFHFNFAVNIYLPTCCFAVSFVTMLPLFLLRCIVPNVKIWYIFLLQIILQNKRVVSHIYRKNGICAHFVCLFVCVFVCMCVCLYVCVCLYLCLFVYVFVFVCMCVALYVRLCGGEGFLEV